MPRPRVSAENLKAALEFALVVTTQEDAGASSFVARHGPCSMYAALGQYTPGILRDHRPTSNRKGVSDAEFLRVLAEEGSFVRFRDRKAVKMSADPTGAGMCMFKARRWRDPSDPTDLKFLHEQHRGLTSRHAAFANVPFERMVSTLSSIIALWDQHMSADPNMFRTDSLTSSTCASTVGSESSVSSPDFDAVSSPDLTKHAQNTMPPSSPRLSFCAGKRSHCSSDDQNESIALRMTTTNQKPARAAKAIRIEAQHTAGYLHGGKVGVSGDWPCAATCSSVGVTVQQVPTRPDEYDSKHRSIATTEFLSTIELPSTMWKMIPSTTQGLCRDTSNKESDCIVPGHQLDLWEMSPVGLEGSDWTVQLDRADHPKWSVDSVDSRRHDFFEIDSGEECDDGTRI